jgi:hypoxanthine phosphoribosyltransferase
LKGGHQYFADLVNCIKKLRTKDGKTIPLSLEFIRVKSYKNDQSEGVTMSLTDEECNDFKGKVRDNQ